MSKKIILSYIIILIAALSAVFYFCSLNEKEMIYGFELCEELDINPLDAIVFVLDEKAADSITITETSELKDSIKIYRPNILKQKDKSFDNNLSYTINQEGNTVNINNYIGSYSVYNQLTFLPYIQFNSYYNSIPMTYFEIHVPKNANIIFRKS